MQEIALYENDKNAFRKGVDYCISWGNEHQVIAGVAEMALGAGVIAWGLQNGLVDLGTDIVGSKWADVGGVVSAGAGAIGVPAIASTLLKSVFIGGVSGISGVTMVPAIPAILLVSGGAMIFGACGYTTAGIAEDFFGPGFSDYLEGASVTAVGLALLIDGARRVATDDSVLETASRLKDDVIQLVSASAEIPLKTWEELQAILKEMSNAPESQVISGTAGVTGAAIGGCLATGTVTVLGSHGLGAVALSLGLVSAPVWPIIAGGAAGLAMGYGGWKAFTSYKKRKSCPQIESPVILL